MKKYEEIYHEIREKILMSVYPEKTRIPSKRIMADRAGVSINTVEIAYLQLIEEGYIEPRQRSGYYVAELDYLTHRRGIIGYKGQDKSIDYLPLKSINDYGDKDHGQKNYAIKSDTKYGIKSNTGNEIKYDTKDNTKNEIKNKEYQYNFSYGGVDKSFPFGIWKKINREVIDSYQDTLLNTVGGMGYEPLRESICNYLYETRSIVSQKDNMIISSGTEAMFEILFRLWDDDIKFGLENPGFERWSSFLKTNKVAYSCLNMDDEGIVLDDLFTSNVDIACVTPNHQFPTGKIMPIARRIKLLDWAIENDGWIIEDDYDGEFKYTGSRIPALKSMDDMDRVIYMGTFSSTISPAIRVSYMILPDELLTRYKDRLSYKRCPVTTMTQIGLDIFIRRGYYHRHVNRMKKIYRGKREMILSILEPCGKLVCRGADAGLHMVVSFKNIDEAELVRRAKENGIMIRGLSDYYIEDNEEYERDSVLLGFAVMELEDIEIATSKLKNIFV